MATTHTASINAKMVVSQKAVEGADQELIFSNSATYTSKALLKDTSAPSINETFADDRQLTAGTETIDLTALIGENWGTVDFSDNRLIMFAIDANDDNTGNLVITPAIANGYAFFGGTSDQLTLPPGGQVSGYIPSGLPLVSASAKDITVSSTDTDAKYKVVFAAGT